MKHLVVCVDGTWQSLTLWEERRAPATNIGRIATSLTNDHHRQRVLYIPGVGTDGRLDWLLGGAYGSGVTQRIRRAYCFLSRNYTPGDKLFLFGFSRGAFVIRRLVEVIEHVGLCEPRRLTELPDDMFWTTKPVSCNLRPVAVDFVGLFDTVASYGPRLAVTKLVLQAVLRRTFELDYVTLPHCVRSAAHALALNEPRSDFMPVIFEANPNSPDQTLVQMWFAGVHADIGGGYMSSDLSDIPFRWMVDKAIEAGAHFLPLPPIRANPAGRMHDSLRGPWRMRPRRERLIEPSHYIHPSVLMR